MLCRPDPLLRRWLPRAPFVPIVLAISLAAAAGAAERPEEMRYDGVTLRDWMQQLKSAGPGKQWTALLVVGDFGQVTKAVVPALVAALDDESHEIRIRAAE